MKKTVIVMPHQENQATPIAAAEASVSIVRMAQTVKRTRSARPRTRSRAGTSCAAGEPVRASKSHGLRRSYRNPRLGKHFRPVLAG